MSNSKDKKQAVNGWTKLNDVAQCADPSHPIVLNNQVLISSSFGDKYNHYPISISNIENDSYGKETQLSYPDDVNLFQHSSVYDWKRKRVYIFGGANHACFLILDLDPSQKPTWTTIVDKNTSEDVRQRYNVHHVGAFPGLLVDTNGTLHVIGGDRSNKHFTFNEQKQVFEQQFEFPSKAIYGFNIHEDTTNKRLILIGGYGGRGAGYFKDVWFCNMGSGNEYTWSSPDVFSLKNPLYGFGSMHLKLSNSHELILILGGQTGILSYNDSIFVLNLTENTFTEMKNMLPFQYLCYIVLNHDVNSKLYNLHLFKNYRIVEHYKISLMKILPKKYRKLSPVCVNGQPLNIESIEETKTNEVDYKTAIVRLHQQTIGMKQCLIRQKTDFLQHQQALNEDMNRLEQINQQMNEKYSAEILKNEQHVRIIRQIYKEMEGLTQQITNLKENNRKLKNEFEETVQKYGNQQAEKENEYKTLLHQQFDKNNQLFQQKTRLAKENESLKNVNQEMNTEIGKKQKQIDFLSTNIVEQVDELKRDVKNVKDTSAIEKRKLNAKIDALTQERDALKRNNQNLQQQLLESTVNATKLETIVKSYNEKVRPQEQRLQNDLKQKSDALEALTRQKENLLKGNQSLTEMNREIDEAYKLELTKKQQEIDLLSKSMAGKGDALKQEIKNVKDEAAMKQQKMVVAIDNLTKEKNSLGRKYENLRHELLESKGKTHQLHDAAEMRRQATISKQKWFDSELEKNTKRMGKLIREKSSLAQKLEELEHTKEDFEHEKNKLATLHRNLTEKNLQFVEENKHLSGDLEALQKQAERSNAEIGEFDEIIQRHVQTIDMNQTKFTDEMQQKNQEMQELMQRIETLQQQNATLSNENRSLLDSENTARSEIDQQLQLKNAGSGDPGLGWLIEMMDGCGVPDQESTLRSLESTNYNHYNCRQNGHVHNAEPNNGHDDTLPPKTKKINTVVIKLSNDLSMLNGRKLQSSIDTLMNFWNSQMNTLRAKK